VTASISNSAVIDASVRFINAKIYHVVYHLTVWKCLPTLFYKKVSTCDALVEFTRPIK